MRLAILCVGDETDRHVVAGIDRGAELGVRAGKNIHHSTNGLCRRLSHHRRESPVVQLFRGFARLEKEELDLMQLRSIVRDAEEMDSRRDRRHEFKAVVEQRDVHVGLRRLARISRRNYAESPPQSLHEMRHPAIRIDEADHDVIARHQLGNRVGSSSNHRRVRPGSRDRPRRRRSGIFHRRDELRRCVPAGETEQRSVMEILAGIMQPEIDDSRRNVGDRIVVVIVSGDRDDRNVGWLRRREMETRPAAERHDRGAHCQNRLCDFQRSSSCRFTNPCDISDVA
jgi:hypothetical protein